MKIIAIPGSLREGSSTTALIHAAIRTAPAGVEFDIYQGLADLPHFSPEIDTEDSIPAVAHARERLAAADAILICTPEYAFGIPGSLKNLLDWTVSSAEFNGKPTAAISASPLSSGGDKAHASLMHTLTAVGSVVPDEAKLCIPYVRQKLSAEGVANEDLEAELRTVMNALVACMCEQRTVATV